jgi:hypothetical protein
MVLCCVYAREVWFLVSQWTDGLVKVPARGVAMADWWNGSLASLSKKVNDEGPY